MSTSPVDALQKALAAEHAAVYVFAVLGARTSASRTPKQFHALDEAFHTHRRRRDQLAAMVVRHGGTPVAAEVAYDLPGALDLEHRMGIVYGELVAGTVGADRRWALAALDDSAVRQLAFRGSPEKFPGMA